MSMFLTSRAPGGGHQLADVAGEARSVAGLMRQASAELGMLAGWRLARQANAMRAEHLTAALTMLMAAQREQLAYRVRLDLDEAKKRMVRDNVAATAMIEREIAALAGHADAELQAQVFTFAKRAAEDEVERKRAVEAGLAAGEIEPARAEALRRRIEASVDGVIARAEQVAERLIVNLGERLERALAPASA